MGVWADGPFDSDQALDGLLDMFETPDGSWRSDYRAALRQGLALVADGQGYLSDPDVAGAVAAAALVALRAGARVQHHSMTTERLLEECPFEVDAELLRLAARAIDRAFDARGNEWWELRDEAGGVEDVRAALAPYRAVLGP